MFVYIIDNDCLKLTEFQKVLYYLGTKESTDEPVMPYSFKITVQVNKDFFSAAKLKERTRQVYCNNIWNDLTLNTSGISSHTTTVSREDAINVPGISLLQEKTVRKQSKHTINIPHLLSLTTMIDIHCMAEIYTYFYLSMEYHFSYKV